MPDTSNVPVRRPDLLIHLHTLFHSEFRIYNYTQFGYSLYMKAVFKEMSTFERVRTNYFSEDEYSEFQKHLMDNPESGKVIGGTGGLRKIRWRDPSRGKGKRGRIRVIYYWFLEGRQFWLFTAYGKDEMEDLTKDQKKQLKKALQKETQAR